MPVLGLIFLRYAYSRFKLVEAEILKNRPMRNGKPLPVEASDFAEKSALFLPREAQYAYLVNLPANISPQNLRSIDGNVMNSLGEVVNNAVDREGKEETMLAKKYEDIADAVRAKGYSRFAETLDGIADHYIIII